MSGRLSLSSSSSSVPPSSVLLQNTTTLASIEQSGIKYVHLANVNNRVDQYEPYFYRWQVPLNSQFVIKRRQTSYEKQDKAHVRFLTFAPQIQNHVTFEQIQLTLVPINLNGPSFTSTIRPCPTTNCNTTYVYLKHLNNQIDISLDNVNELGIDFLVDQDQSLDGTILIEMESWHLLDFE